MIDQSNDDDAGREAQGLIRRTTVIVILLFWTVQFSVLTLWRAIDMPEEGTSLIVPRIIVACIGVGISFGIVAIHGLTQGRSFGRRVAVTIVVAMVGCVLHAIVNLSVFSTLRPVENAEAFSLASYAVAIIQWLWVYTALSSMLLALAYSADLRDRERRMAQLQAIAHAAQLRALRYQLNPHFLFNTLNSIAALIAQNRPQIAESMVENLSDFLRAGLALDPHDDIPLAREIELQSLYLDIEALRFPDRLKIEIDIADGLGGALVPGLIIQPLVENAVKYAVAKSTRPVTLRIAAHEADERLQLEVSDRGSDAPAPSETSTGVGLANIAARLRARFGDAFAFSAGREGEGFAARIAIPLARAA